MSLHAPTVQNSEIPAKAATRMRLVLLSMRSKGLIRRMLAKLTKGVMHE